MLLFWEIIYHNVIAIDRILKKEDSEEKIVEKVIGRLTEKLCSTLCFLYCISAA